MPANESPATTRIERRGDGRIDTAAHAAMESGAPVRFEFTPAGLYRTSAPVVVVGVITEIVFAFGEARWIVDGKQYVARRVSWIEA